MSPLGWLSRKTSTQTKIKSFQSEIQDGRHGCHLENLFFASSPELKDQLSRNLVGIIEVTCRSKIAKIVPIGNTRWLPQLPSWKAILNFFSWIEGQLSWNLIGSIGVTFRSKIAKIKLSKMDALAVMLKICFYLIIMNLGQNVRLDHLWVLWYSGERYRAIMALLLDTSADSHIELFKF